MGRSIRSLIKVTLIVAAAWTSAPSARGQQRNLIDTWNSAGVLRSYTLDGIPLDRTNPFFQDLGTNGRSCASCHVPSSGWAIAPAEVQERFRRTDGLDPIFRPNDGANSPQADLSTVAARRTAYSMLLNKGLIRVGLPILNASEFDLIEVDDPYQFAGAAELSLFRRPMPTSNLRFLTEVMWDGRESFGPFGTFPILPNASPEQNLRVLFEDLKHQGNGATLGHAEGLALTDAQSESIAQFELNLVSAQITDRVAGSLTAQGGRGGPAFLAAQPFYVTINDARGADVLTGRFDRRSMTLFDAWTDSANPRRASIARGAALFGTARFDITGVGGLNDDLGRPTIRGSCTSCHDTPNVGNHSVPFPYDIGLTDESRRTPDMPLYTLRNHITGATRKTSDPGRALLTGNWRDIGKFKAPVLRGLASRPPFFHNGLAADLGEVVDFYDTRFGIGLTAQEKADLVAFLEAL